MPDYSQQNRSQTLNRTELPKRYHVVMHNDDITTMDFVVLVLRVIFLKPASEAMQLMLRVHQSGSAVVGTYSYDIAVTKTARAMQMAKDQGFPFRMTIEPAD